MFRIIPAVLLRDAKDGKHIPADLVRSLPDLIAKPRAVLWDNIDPAVLYVFDVPDDERTGKLVVRLNYKDKGRALDGKRYTVRSNSLRTSGLVQRADLQVDRYDVIQGAL